MKRGMASQVEVARSRRVLIVDDDEDQLFILQTLLEESDSTLEVVSVRSVQDVAKVVSRSGIDCIIADVMMPCGGGVALLQELRKSHKELPIIMTSAGRDDLEGELLAHGATGFFPKYDSENSLVRAVRDLISSSQNGKSD
jgi:two-component system nitrogen regulation response regulator GlnG